MRFVTDVSRGILGSPDPAELWNNILVYIPDSVLASKHTKILSVACGHATEADVLVKRMRFLGLTLDEIKDKIYLLDKYKVFLNEADRKGYINLIHTDFMEWESDMKFDVIVGNPPYQDQNKTEKGGTTLWSRFVKKSIELTKDNGHIAMITPNAWLGFGKSGKPMKPYQLTKVYTQIDHYFPNIGSTFTGWVLEKTPVYKETDFIDENISIDLRHYDSLPVGRPIKGLPIIEKVLNCDAEFIEPKLETKLQGGWSSRSEEFINGCNGSFTKTKTHKYKVFHTNSLFYFVDEEPTDYNAPKIIVSVSSPMPKLFLEPIGCAAGDLRCYILVKDEKEGREVLSYLNSKLYRFVWRRPGMISWKNLKVPKLENKLWSDTELYDFFNLSSEEIELVENYHL